MADDAVTAERVGKRWRWTWRAPWAATTTSAATYKTKASALAAGRAWLRDNA